MGYTHYWTFKKPSTKVKGTADAVEAKYKKALVECAKIAYVYNNECASQGLDDSRLSGFSAHTRPGKYGGLAINGKGENAHELLSMREHYRQNFEGIGSGFGFCKTARKPYDVVVTACLALLKHRLGDLIDVSSDGIASDWTEGIKLARQVTGAKIENPIGSCTSNAKDPLETLIEAVDSNFTKSKSFNSISKAVLKKTGLKPNSTLRRSFDGVSEVSWLIDKMIGEKLTNGKIND